MMLRAVACALACGLLWAAVPAAVRAQDATRTEIDLQNQILELRHDLDALRNQVGSGAGSSAPSSSSLAPPQAADTGAPVSNDMTAQLLDRVSRLEDQARTLQGSIDELHNGLQAQNADLSKQIADLSFRVQTLEGGKPPTASGGTDAPSPAPPVAAPRPAVAPSESNHASLQQGYAALARRDYPAAAAAARDTLAVPHAPRAYDAQFLLAQAYAGQHDYQKAALAFNDAYKKQPKGPHAQDSLVGLASSLSALGAKPAACATLSKLHIEFTDLRPDVRASASFIGHRANCA